jgi:hypothetical protein
MKVKLQIPLAADGRDFQRSLTLGREYEVIGIEANDFRLINNMCEPILYDACCFEITDSTEPEFWKSCFGDQGERYAYPPDWNARGYFEDWHDGVVAVKSHFRDTLERLYPWTIKAIDGDRELT